MRRAARQLLFVIAISKCVADSSQQPNALRPMLLPRSLKQDLVADRERLPTRTWRLQLTDWAERNAGAAWFPWVLAGIGFMDPFTMCGFLLSPLLTLALFTASPQRA